MSTLILIFCVEFSFFSFLAGSFRIFCRLFSIFLDVFESFSMVFNVYFEGYFESFLRIL
jgi:hypothetical protein